MRMVMIVLALILISCKKEIEPKPAVKTVDSVKVVVKDSTPKYDTSIVYTSNESERFVFKFKLDSTGESVSTIFIMNTADSSLFQEIIPDTNWMWYAKEHCHWVIKIEDMNFDGEKDFRICNGDDGTGVNSGWQCWLYDIQKTQFVKEQTLSSLCIHTIDSLKKEVTTFVRGGGGIYRQESYKFIDKEFQLVSKKSFEITGEGALLVHKRIINGKMKTILSTIVPADSGFEGFNPSDYPKKKRTN